MTHHHGKNAHEAGTGNRRTLQRETIAHGWQRYRWPIIGLVWAVALLLGYIGFIRTTAAMNESHSPLDILYLTLQLIPLNSGAVDSPVTWELDVARLLIPALAAYTVWQAAAALFREQFASARLRRMRDHVVICGLSRKGWLLAKGFLEQGWRVVVIENDEDNDLIEACQSRGAEVVIGDATTYEVLRKTAATKARHVVAVTADDGINVEIGLQVESLVSQIPQAHDKDIPLTCTIHMVDPQLYELARTRELMVPQTPLFQLELFNVFDRAGQILWEEHQPKGALAPDHLLVLGLGRLGTSLVVHAARDRYRQLKGATGQRDRLHITVIDQQAELRCRALCLHYPQFARVCELTPLEMNVNSPEFETVAECICIGNGVPPDTGYVCFDNDSLSLRTALALHHGLRRVLGRPVPIVVRMAESGGLSRLLTPGDGSNAMFANIEIFSMLERTCNPRVILGGTHELLARANHQKYVQGAAARGETYATNPSMLPWEQLSDDMRRSNYAQAGYIDANLHSLGYVLAPLTDWDAEDFRFTDAEVDHMAQLEHERYVAEKKAAGWSYAPEPKDELRKTNPTLVPWDVLPDVERKKDRDICYNLPTLLARAGFQIVKPVLTSAVLANARANQTREQD
jgi:voltage-gated potassium channel Kch